MHQRRLGPEEMEEFKAKRCVSAVFLQYEDWQWELIHMNQPLTRFKLETTIGIFVLTCITCIQFFNIVWVFLQQFGQYLLSATSWIVNIYSNRNSWAYIFANTIILLGAIFVSVMIWFDVLYRKVRYRNIKRSRFSTIRKIYKFVELTLTSLSGRLILVSVILLLCLLSAWLPLVSCIFLYIIPNHSITIKYQGITLIICSDVLRLCGLGEWRGNAGWLSKNWRPYWMFQFVGNNSILFYLIFL